MVYTALSAQRLGANVSVISKVGTDFSEAYFWWLRQEGIDLSNVNKIENACTTRFELRYSEDLSHRTMRLACKAPPIAVRDIPNALRAKAVHVAPIAGEVEHEVIEKLKKRADFLSLDPQGFLRIFDENGNMSYGTLANKRILELVNIYKSSSEEIKSATSLSDINSAIRAVHDFGVEIVRRE